MKARLTITLVYSEDATEQEVLDNLNYVADHAAGEGLFTGTGDFHVESWDHKVETNIQPQVVATRVWVPVASTDGRLPGWTDYCPSCGSQMDSYDDGVVRCMDDECDFEHSGEYRKKAPYFGPQE